MGHPGTAPQTSRLATLGWGTGTTTSGCTPIWAPRPAEGRVRGGLRSPRQPELHQAPRLETNKPTLRRIPGRHLRETQVLLAWLRKRDSRLVQNADLREWLSRRPPGPWIELLQEAVEEHEVETGAGEGPVDSLVEWLAEWGREVRRRQRGLLLLTAHRAKGLEFRHVVVLDGRWDRVGHQEDPDAPRRLYYVSMTRARRTLALGGWC